MANSTSTARTNYFAVIDEEKYQKIFKRLRSNDLHDFTEEKDGVLKHGFGGYDSIDYICTLDKNENVIKYLAEGGVLYNSDGLPIDAAKLIEEEEVFDKNQDCIASVWDDYEDISAFVKDLQPLLPDGECFVYMEAYSEKLRYVGGYAIVATNKHIKSQSLSNFIDCTVKELLGPDAKTKYTY